MLLRGGITVYRLVLPAPMCSSFVGNVVKEHLKNVFWTRVYCTSVFPPGLIKVIQGLNPRLQYSNSKTNSYRHGYFGTQDFKMQSK